MQPCLLYLLHGATTRLKDFYTPTGASRILRSDSNFLKLFGTSNIRRILSNSQESQVKVGNRRKIAPKNSGNGKKKGQKSARKSATVSVAGMEIKLSGAGGNSWQK